MAMIVTAMIFGAALLGIALLANARLRREDRLPMQWTLGGEVVWSAPRPIALVLIPALALPALAGLTILSFTVPSRPGQEGLMLPTLIGIGVVFVAIQLLHLWLIDRTLVGMGHR